MTRRCSHCSHNGHNSRTCPNRGVKLFGVRLTDGSIRKSASMGNLTHYMGAGSGIGPLNAASPSDGGYASEDLVAASSSSRERKKGVPWTEDEHRLFLVGLQKLGKGDWRGIARNYVVSRTPTQVASHAQKYFIRQINVSSRRKRRSSLFDIVALADHHESVDNPAMSRDYIETLSDTPVVPPDQSVEEECESMESANSNDAEIVVPEAEESTYPPYPIVYPAYVAPVFQMPIQFWPAVESDKEETHHQVVKPTAVLSKKPINVDELVGMSKLSLGESLGDGGPSILSLQLVEGTSTRPSAFHASNPAATGSTSGMNSTSSHNPIHAI